MSREKKNIYLIDISSLCGLRSVSCSSNGYGRNHRNFVPDSRKNVCAWNGGIAIILFTVTLNSFTIHKASPSGDIFCKRRTQLHSSNTNISEIPGKFASSRDFCHTDFLWKWFPSGTFPEYTSNFWTEKSDPLYSWIDLRSSLCTCSNFPSNDANRGERLFLTTLDQ